MTEDMSMTRFVTDEREKQGVYGGVGGCGSNLHSAERGGGRTVSTASGQAFGAFHLTPRHDARLYPESGYTRRYRRGKGGESALSIFQRKRCPPASRLGFGQGGVTVYPDFFSNSGIRIMHLTYNRRNMIGDGCAEPANAGLSDFGRAVVAEMNRVGVIVDVAHLWLANES